MVQIANFILIFIQIFNTTIIFENINERKFFAQVADKFGMQFFYGIHCVNHKIVEWQLIANGKFGFPDFCWTSHLWKWILNMYIHDGI